MRIHATDCQPPINTRTVSIYPLHQRHDVGNLFPHLKFEQHLFSNHAKLNGHQPLPKQKELLGWTVTIPSSLKPSIFTFKQNNEQECVSPF